MRTRLLIPAIVVVGALVSLVRVPLSHLDTVWAEDGSIFLLEAINSGPLGVLVHGYAGYQHFIPRVVTALLVPGTPLGAYGILVFVACAIITGLIAAAVFWLSRDLVPWLPARLGLAAVTILLPLSAQEVLGNMADIHSYCLWLAPWLMLYRPRSWRGGIGWGLVALACAMTEIQMIIFIPLALLNLGREHRKAWPIAAGFALGALAQVVTTLSTPRPSTAYWLGIPSLIHGYLYNTVLPMLNPNPAWQGELIVASGAIVPALMALPFIAAGIVVLVFGTGRQRILVITLVLASGAIYAGGATIDGSPGFAYTYQDNSTVFSGILNSRYGVASGMMLAATVPLAAATLIARAADRVSRVATLMRTISWVAIVGLVVLFSVASTQSVSSRSSGLTWSGGVQQARIDCESLPPDEPAKVNIAPHRYVPIPCEYLATHW